jgi:hypothetical protein
MGAMTSETITRSAGPRRPIRRAAWAVAGLSFCGAILVSGCTSSSTSSDKPPSPPVTNSAAASAKVSPAVCVHINSLRTSLTSLTHIKVSPASAKMLTADLTNIEDQLAALKGKPTGSFSTTALTADIDKIKKDAAALSTKPTTAVKSLTTDLAALKTKSGPMIVQMKKVCHMK